MLLADRSHDNADPWTLPPQHERVNDVAGPAGLHRWRVNDVVRGAPGPGALADSA